MLSLRDFEPGLSVKSLLTSWLHRKMQPFLFICAGKPLQYQRGVKQIIDGSTNSRQNEGTMITDFVIDLERKDEYYRKGYWSDKTLLDCWNEQVATYGDTECTSDNLGQHYTYAQLDDRAARLAHWLKDAGIKEGDVVSLQLPPWAEFYVVFIACMKLGAVCHPIPVTFNAEDMDYALNLVESKAFICPTFHHKTDFEAQILDTVGRISTLSQDALLVQDKLKPAHTLKTMSEVFETYEPLEEAPKTDADQIALILLTSGTTGRPKAVLFTHNSLIFSVRTFIQRLCLGHTDIMLMPAPLNHATGFKYGLITPMLLGGKVVYQHEFDSRQAFDLIKEEGVTWSMGATPFLYDLFDCAEANDLSFESLKLYVCGGAAVPSVMVKRADSHGVTLCECYGSTESSPHVIVPPDKCLEWDGQYSGIACDGIEVKVVDVFGNEVAPGKQGEEVSRGPQMFNGYYKQPEATAKELTEDGWFYSGDLCTQDELGRIKIVGRKKEIIIRGGENISVVEVDQNIKGCPGVGDHATVGLPDKRLGERICTFVVKTGDVTPTVESVAAYLDSKGIAKRLRPERIEFIDAIPMTDSGKIKRNLLSEELKRRLAAQ